MGQRSERARRALMDAAEELYARHGIDAVSNRRIAEYAGASNHSAVTYHFGSREGLIEALVRRQGADIEARREDLIAELDDDAGLWDLIACRILPFVEQLHSLPAPSWRARFLGQVSDVHVQMDELRTWFEGSDSVVEVTRRVRAHLDGVPERVQQARSGIISHLVLGVCAEYEARVEAGAHEGTWIDVGYFLIDTATGMVSAPVSHLGSQIVPQVSLRLI